GGRMDLGIGRGDSARRVLGKKPTSMQDLEEAVHVIRALGLNGAEMVFIPSATSRGLSEYLWRVEQVSHALANGYFVGTINRVGVEKEIGDDDFYGQSYFVDPRGQFIGAVGDPYAEELIIRDMDLDVVQQVRQTWQFYRDRRPDAYGDLVRP
ncbi:MAG TPA: nitrilase-related carbon-nitrogen hydrolase, partial [Candidatus Limnocylindrales bacterium]